MASIAKNPIFPGRYTAEASDTFVLFLIGLRFNGLRGLRHALRAFFEMPRMLAELEKQPKLGLLGYRLAFDLRSVTVIQYWRSFEDLEAFAKDPEHAHHAAWRWFNKLGRDSRDAGIWHETYKIQAGGYETVYVNMPRFGLAAATGHRPVGGGRNETARQRIAASGSLRSRDDVPA